MKNSTNYIEVKIQTLSDNEKNAYGYGAQWEVEIAWGKSKALIIVDSCLGTIKAPFVSSNENDMFSKISDLVHKRIKLQELLLKLATPTLTVSMTSLK